MQAAARIVISNEPTTLITIRLNLLLTPWCVAYTHSLLLVYAANPFGVQVLKLLGNEVVPLEDSNQPTPHFIDTATLFSSDCHAGVVR